MEVKFTCAECGDAGFIDAGGFSPWGEPVNLPCPACTGRRVRHANLGECFINDACKEMQKFCTDKGSIYVVHDFDIKEVTKAMVTELDGSPVKI